MPRRRLVAVAGVLVLMSAAAAALGTPLPVSWSDDDVATIRDSQRATDLLVAKAALFAYFARFGGYPQGLAELTTTNHLRELPRDPLSGVMHGSSDCAAALEAPSYGYGYRAEPGGKAFLLYACLELGPERVLLVRSYE